jgi:hypothetical protein
VDDNNSGGLVEAAGVLPGKLGATVVLIGTRKVVGEDVPD